MATTAGSSASQQHQYYIILAVVLISTISLGGVRCYDVYDEDEDIGLPGSASDGRDLPNSPFTVDANRLSDGVSSVSPLSTTSPSFPVYKNKTDDRGNDLARQWANLTMASRLEQGVSPRGAGGFEIAVSRHNVLQGDYSTGNPSVAFSVHAWKRWNPSAFAIQQGETYTVEVPGEQYWQDEAERENISTDAGGYTAYYDAVDSCWVAIGQCRSFLNGAQPRVPPPRARWLELVCGIGDYVSRIREALSGDERYLPINDEALQKTLLPVGLNLTFVAQATGELICFANDAEGLYGNNRATINVTVTRTSWPPDGTVEPAYEAYIDGASIVHP
ncbi:unnamed protein product [Pylaiella littoralis]